MYFSFKELKFCKIARGGFLGGLGGGRRVSVGLSFLCESFFFEGTRDNIKHVFLDKVTIINYRMYFHKQCFYIFLILKLLKIKI